MTSLVEDPEAAPEPVPDGTERGLGVFLVVLNAVGLLSSVMLTIEKFDLLTAQADGDQITLGCDINAFVSCSGVMGSEQGAVFGFPNPMIGLIGFPVAITLGVLLICGLRFPAWIWGGLQLGVLFGIGFLTWLQYESIFVLDRLCPWCIVLWVVMIPIFVLVTARNAPGRFLRNWSGLIIALWYIALAGTILIVFGDSLWA